MKKIIDYMIFYLFWLSIGFLVVSIFWHPAFAIFVVLLVLSLIVHEISFRIERRMNREQTYR